MSTLRINGVGIPNAQGFCWDDCHKIYIIQSDEDRTSLEGMGYEVSPLEKLQEAWDDSCGLRFISPASLKGPDFISQMYEGDVKIEVE